MHAFFEFKRRTTHFLSGLLLATLPSCFALTSATAAIQDNRLVIAVPGPGNLLYLPVELAQKIGADTAEGGVLELRYFSGGPQAIRDVLDRNSDFLTSGLPALAEQKAAGHPVRSISALSRVPAYSLLVRSSYKGKIRKIADLKGRVREAQGAEIIQAIMHMADAFHLNAVAEGVEDEESAQLLKSYGVRYLQGFLFGKPMPAEEMDELLRGK